MDKKSKTNRLSYFLTMLFVLPAFVLGRTAGNSDELIAGVARILTLTLLVFLIVWTIRRLQNAGKSGWWTFALIPPATIFLLAYCFFAPSSEKQANKGVSIYGITAKGFWRIAGIVIISIFLVYVSALYATFLSDGL